MNDPIILGNIGKNIEGDRRKHKQNNICDFASICPEINISHNNVVIPLIITFEEPKKEDKIWKTIDGFEKYEIDMDGNIRHKKTYNIISQHKNSKGYKYVGLRIGSGTGDSNKKTIAVHTLVAKTYLEDYYDGCQINHKDGNINNNNYLNLECCNNSENMKHRFEVLLKTGIKQEKPRGVSKYKNRWMSRCHSIKDKKNYCKIFNTKKEAYRWYFYKFIELNNYQPWDENYYRVFIEDKEIIPEYDYLIHQKDLIDRYKN